MTEAIRRRRERELAQEIRRVIRLRMPRANSVTFHIELDSALRPEIDEITCQPELPPGAKMPDLLKEVVGPIALELALEGVVIDYSPREDGCRNGALVFDMENGGVTLRLDQTEEHEAEAFVILRAIRRESRQKGFKPTPLTERNRAG